MTYTFIVKIETTSKTNPVVSVSTKTVNPKQMPFSNGKSVSNDDFAINLQSLIDKNLKLSNK